MNPSVPATESFISIQKVFDKAQSLYLSTSSSTYPSRHDARQRPVLSFEGQVVHCVSAVRETLPQHALSPSPIGISTFTSTITTKITSSEAERARLPELPSDPVCFPLHPKALRTFKKMHNKAPDHVVWLSPLPDSAKTSVEAERAGTRGLRQNLIENQDALRKLRSMDSQQRSEAEKHRIIFAVESGDDMKDKKSKVGQVETNDDASVVSWSDSDCGCDSRLESAEDEIEPTFPTVAVLFSNESLDTVGNDGRPSAHTSEPVFRSGCRVQISKAAMLWEKIKEMDVKDRNKGLVVSFLGVVGAKVKTRFSIVPGHCHKNGKKASEAQGAADSLHPRRIGKRALVLEQGPLYQKGREGSKKRTRMDTPSPEVENNIAKNKKSHLEPALSPKKIKPHLSEFAANRSNAPMLMTFYQQRDLLRHMDPLDLLVRELRQGADLRRSKPKTGLIYFSDLWSAMPLATATSATSARSDPSTSANPSAAPGREFGNINCDTATTVSRHVCWLTHIHSVTIRALCDECKNGYKRMSCDFGCRSHKWRLQIQMECSVSDGTAEAKLLVLEDQESEMWTLLGLMKKSRADLIGDDTAEECSRIRGSETGGEGADTGAGTDLQRDLRDKVLRIVARRGELSYETNPRASDNKLAAKGYASGDGNEQNYTTGYVVSIDRHQTHQERAEEEIWLDICSSTQQKRDSFLLHTTVMSKISEPRGSTLSSTSSAAAPSTETSASEDLQAAASRTQAQLKTSSVRMNRRTTIQTLVRPPLILRAVEVERILPQTEAKILLDQLRM